MKKKIGRTSWIPTILFLIYGLIVFILLYVTIVSSFKSKTEITTNMFGLPQQWRIENYVRVIKDEHFLTYMLNSLILLVGSVIGLLIVSSLLALSLIHIQMCIRDSGKGESPGYRNLRFRCASGASPWSPFLSRCAGPRVFRRCNRGGGRRNQA